MVLFPFNRWGSRGSESLSDMSWVIERVNSRDRVWIHKCQILDLGHFLSFLSGFIWNQHQKPSRPLVNEIKTNHRNAVCHTMLQKIRLEGPSKTRIFSGPWVLGDAKILWHFSLKNARSTDTQTLAYKSGEKIVLSFIFLCLHIKCEFSMMKGSHSQYTSQ